MDAKKGSRQKKCQNNLVKRNFLLACNPLDSHCVSSLPLCKEIRKSRNQGITREWKTIGGSEYSMKKKDTKIQLNMWEEAEVWNEQEKTDKGNEYNMIRRNKEVQSRIQEEEVEV